MSEKEIIIDGIDINKCQHYTGNVEYLSREWTCRAETIGTKCEENPNCYFKQCARAKEEIEKLKNQNEMLSKNNSVQQWCDMYNIKDKECFNALLKLGKYQQVIDEIEEFASKHCISTDDYNKIRNNKWAYAFSKGYATARLELINPILDIINKSKEQ